MPCINLSDNPHVARNNEGGGGGGGVHTMQYFARNVGKVELDSTSLTDTRNVTRKVATVCEKCVRVFTLMLARVACENQF